MNKGKIFFKELENSLILRLVGDIRYTDIFGFDKLIEETIKNKKFSKILIDLSDTVSIDSTNLGELAKIANYTKKEFNKKPIIFSPNDDMIYLLNKLGFSTVFNIINRQQAIQSGFSEIKNVSDDKEKTPRIILENHRELAMLSDDNKKLFKNIIANLEKEIK